MSKVELLDYVNGLIADEVISDETVLRFRSITEKVLSEAENRQHCINMHISLREDYLFYQYHDPRALTLEF